MDTQRQYYGIRLRGKPIVFAGSGCLELNPEPSQKILNHSPDGFEWGYAGSGPAQLALAILYDVTEDREISVRLHQEFKSEFIATASQSNFLVSEQEVREWLHKKTGVEIKCQ